MRVSQRELDTELEKKMFGVWLEALAVCRDEVSADELMRDLLTDTERIVIAKRMAIALLLSHGYGYTEVANILKVSPPTISKVKRWLDERGAGFRKVLSLMEEDEQLIGFWDRVERLTSDDE